MMFLMQLTISILFLFTACITLINTIFLKRNPFPKADNGDERFSDIKKAPTRKMYVNKLR